MCAPPPAAILSEIPNHRGQASNLTRYTYTDKGVIASVTNVLGHVTIFDHDAEGKVIAAIDALGRRSEKTYDQPGRVNSLTSPRGETTAAKSPAINMIRPDGSPA